MRSATPRKLRLVKDEKPEKATKRGDPVIAARIKAIRVELGFKRQADLSALMVSAAKKNGGISGSFDQTYMSRIETGALAPDTPHIHTAYAAALGLTLDEWGDYLAGTLSVEDVRRIRDERIAARTGPRTLRRLTNWGALKLEALRLDPALRTRDFEAIADTAVNGPPDKVTAMRVAMLAKIAHEISDE